MEPNTSGDGLSFSVNDQIRPLDMLLFVRSAWGLAQDLDLPPLDPAPDTGASALPAGTPRSVWEARWRQLWLDAWVANASGGFTVPGLGMELLRGAKAELEDGTPVPGSWSVAFGECGIDVPAFQAWDRQLDQMRGVILSEMREPRFMQAIGKGLSEFIVLPLAGYYVHRLGENRMVLSWQTLHDLSLLRRAIDQWLSGAGR